MTKIKFIAIFLLTALITSCSSDENGEQSGAYFDLTYNNQTKKVSSWEAIKQGDFLEVTGTSDGVGIDFKFNVYGNLLQAFTHTTDLKNDIPTLAASENFTSNTFTFTLLNLDNTNKTVEVKFSGKVFEDEYDYESKFIIVSGSFKVPYTEIAPELEGQGTFAKIDGKDWHGLVMSSTVENQQTKILYAENDGEYTIGIALPDYGAKTGTFAFTSNNAANRITFQKYDITTHEYVDYNVSGTVTYTTVNDFYVAGTFSLTATHPVTKAKIVISAGTFKESAN
jgi:hypothetical protein